MNIVKKQGGFTLLELLIVIVIIGILAVLIVPNLISGPQRGRDSQRKNHLRNIKVALETYYTDNNSYPTAGGTSCVPSAAGCLGTVLTAGSPNYIKAVPNDPKGGANYTYTPSPANCADGVCVSYELSATLENTKDKQAPNGIYKVDSDN